MAAPRMTPQEVRDHLARLGLSQNGFARLIRVNEKTVRRWVSLDEPGDVPRAVEIALDLLTPARVKKLIADDEAEG